MRLIKVGCQSYKRFRDRAEMDVDDKLIAIVGPNEAGKSSFLEALAELASAEPFPQSVRTRGTTDQPRVWARFVLDNEDKEALAGIPEARDLRQLVLEKSSRLRYVFEPDVTRDLTPRVDALRILDRTLSHPWMAERDEDDILLQLARSARGSLAADDEDLEEDQIAIIERLATALQNETIPPRLGKLADAIALAHANEKKANPWEAALGVLRKRIPLFLPFEAEARDLRTTYSFDDEPNQALHNLLSLAGTTWHGLYTASSDPGGLEGALEVARERLDETFSAWSQTPLVVRISVADNAVSVMVRMSARTDYLGIEERSDGLRQFVALRAHVASRGGVALPILLVDEADVHLHYNAQADLVQVLESQQEAAKVIYTTHSAGCLPQDLGRGIRIIVPQPDSDDSRVINWFWAEDASGSAFSPLLIGMGASTLAFASTRRAVIAEGAADAILLPTMVREVTGLETLHYQIAPGLANVDAAAVSELDLVAARVAYVLDGDAAGDSKQKLLIDAGVPKERILRLGSRRSPIVLEDLLNEDVYLDSVNEELARWRQDMRIPKSAMKPVSRPASVVAWCNRQNPPVPAPSKRAVAHRVLERAKAGPIVARQRRRVVQNLHDAIERLLDQPSYSQEA